MISKKDKITILRLIFAITLWIVGLILAYNLKLPEGNEAFNTNEIMTNTITTAA